MNVNASKKSCSCLRWLGICLAFLLVFAWSAQAAQAENFDTSFGSHGQMQVTSSTGSNTIQLSPGEDFEITITPYQHVQYGGCCMWGFCPETCGGLGACFVPGMGCQCVTTPMTRTAVIETSVMGDGQIEVSKVTADGTLGSEIGSMVNGKMTVKAISEGTVVLEVKAIGHHPLVDNDYTQNPDFLFWQDCTQTFTIQVGEGGSQVTVPQDQPGTNNPAPSTDTPDGQQTTVDTVNISKDQLQSVGYRLWVSNGTTQSTLDPSQLTETGQTIHLQVKFNQPIVLNDAAACRQQLNLQIAGRTPESLYRVVSVAKNSSDNTMLDITMQADPNTQGVDSDSMVAQYNSALTVAAVAADGRLAAVTNQAGEAAYLHPIETVLPTGMAIELVKSTTGTSSTPASATYRFTSIPLVRSMNFMVALSDGQPITDRFTVHSHVFTDNDAEDYIDSADKSIGIVDVAAETLAQLGYTLVKEVAADGTPMFTLTAQKAVAGQELSWQVYSYPWVTAADRKIELAEALQGSTVSQANITAAEAVLYDQNATLEQVEAAILLAKGQTVEISANLTRGEFIEMLGALDGVTASVLPFEPFMDVKADASYASAVLWAQMNSIAQGTGEGGTFAPDQQITRQEAAAFVYRFLNRKDVSLTAAPAEVYDADAVAPYAQEAVAALVGQGIFSTDTGNCFQPKAALTKAEAETILTAVQALLPADGESTDPTGGMFW